MASLLKHKWKMNIDGQLAIITTRQFNTTALIQDGGSITPWHWTKISKSLNNLAYANINIVMTMTTMTTCFIQDDENKIQEKTHLEKEN